MFSIDERLALRTELMKWLYTESEGSQFNFVNVQGFADNNDFPIEEIENAVEYMAGEGLIKALWGGGENLPAVQVLHLGVAEIERVLRNRDEETEHFVALNSINITNVHGDLNTTQYQQGTAHSWQEIIIHSDDIKASWELLSSIRANLGNLGFPKDKENELCTDLDSIEKELSQNEPRSSILSAFFRAVQQVIVSVATNVTSQELLLHMHWPSFL